MTDLDTDARRAAALEREGARDHGLLGGFVVFLISETMFFVPMFASRFVLAGTGHSAALDQVLALGVTALVAISVVPAAGMVGAARSGSWSGLRRNALLTAAIGIAVLAALVVEWWGFDIDPTSRYGGVYYLTVGVHAVHVFVAVLLLVGVTLRSRAGEFTAHSHVAVRAAQLFWYLVAGLWAAVWVVFYLV